VLRACQGWVIYSPRPPTVNRVRRDAVITHGFTRSFIAPDDAKPPQAFDIAAVASFFVIVPVIVLFLSAANTHGSATGPTHRLELRVFHV
jgi:hypothetical protein